MNFKIQHKPEEAWNPILLDIYIYAPKPIGWIVWKIEQLRTPKEFYNVWDGIIY